MQLWPRRRLLAVVIAGWLAFTVALYAWILFGTAGRGSSSSLVLASGPAMLIGLVFVAAGLLKLRGTLAHDNARLVGSLLLVLVGITLGGLYVVHHRGRALYLEDQVKARQFIERRLAAADEQHRMTGKWPADQRTFLGDEPLPRMLRYNWFYYRFAQPDGFELYINIDFDGGWHLTHERRDWRRST